MRHRINITIDEDLFLRLKEYSEKRLLPHSRMIEQLVLEELTNPAIRISENVNRKLDHVLQRKYMGAQASRWAEAKAVEEIAAYESENGVELVVQDGEVTERSKL